LGASFQLTASLAVIAHGFAASEKARVFAIWGTVMGIAPALGPAVGGLVTYYLGWRWAFFINLPLGAGLIALALTSVEESRDPYATRLDFPGIVLFGAGLYSIVWALIDANDVGWESPSTLWKLVAGGLVLIVFIFAERLHPRPMIDLALFRDRTFVGAAIAMLGYAASAQDMIPFALPMLIGPSVGGKLSASFSSRAILTFGLVLVALGNAVAGAASLAGLGYWVVALGMLITGSGAGLLNSETTKAQVSAVPPARAGMASGFAAATRFVGITVGLAGLGAILAAVAESRLRTIGATLVPGEIIDWHAFSLRLVGGDANGALSTLPDTARAALSSAVRHGVAAGFGVTLIAAALIALVASKLSWMLVRDVDTSTAATQQE
jgi:hypothetical protein